MNCTPGRAIAMTTAPAIKDPVTQEIKACCHVNPTLIKLAATFHPVGPKTVNPQ